MPIAIFFDSSFLRGLSPQGPVALALLELVHASEVEVHVSSLVEREVATGLADKAKVQVNTAWVAEPDRSALMAAVKVAEAAPAMIERGVTKWLDDLGAIRHAPTADESTRVWDAYFAGALPFKERKHRNDIPDCFILESLRTYAQTATVRTCFICLDGALAGAVSNIKNVEVHKDFPALLSEIQVKRVTSLEDLRDACDEYLPTLEHMIEEGLGSLIVQAELFDPSLPSDHNEATLVGYGDVTEIDFDWVDATLLGTDVVRIPFHCTVNDCAFDLFVFKAEYWSLSDEEEARFEVFDSDWNEKYLWARFQSDVHVEATIAVQLTMHVDQGVRSFKIGKAEINLEQVEFAESLAKKERSQRQSGKSDP